MADDVSAGRLHIDAYSDTSGFGRALQAKIDAEVKNVRAKIKAELDDRAVVAQAKAAAQKAQKAAQVKIKAQLDQSGLAAQAKAAAAAASEAAKVKIKAEIDQAQFEAALAASVALMSNRYTVHVNVEADTAKADAEVAAFRNRQKGVPLSVGFNIQMGNAGQAIAQLSKIPAIAGGIFLLSSALANVVGGLFAITSAASQSVVALAALPNILGAIGQAGAVLLAGLSGIGGAVQELGQADAASAQNMTKAADIRVDAARRIADAQAALKEAYHQAADAARQAQYAVKDARHAVQEANEDQEASEQALVDAQRNRRRSLRDAEWRLEDAQDSASDAQERLTKARENAQKRIDSLHKSLRSLALTERTATNDLAKAQQQLQDVLWNAASTPQEVADAQLAVAQATAELNDVRETAAETATASAEADAAGVEGSEEVQAAKDAEADAARNLMLAEESLRDSRRETERAVKAAREQIRDANWAVMQAERQLAEARHSQADTAEANQRAIQAAQQAIADAQKGATAATAAQNAALAKQTTEFDKLSPSAQRFALFLYNEVLPRLREVRTAIQDALLPPLETGIRAAMPLLDTLQAGLVGTARVVGDLAIKVGQLFGSQGFNRDTALIMDSNNRALRDFGQATLNLIKWLSDIAVVAGPTLVEPFAKWVRQLTAGWREAAQVGRETGTMADRFETAKERVNQLKDIVNNLAGALYGLGKGAAPAGIDLLNTFEKVTARWDKWANSDLGQDRIHEFFETAKPATEQIGKLVTNLSKFVTLTGEAGGGPLVGLLKTLNGAISGLNWALAQPYLGKFIGWVLTLAGAAGGVGLMAGMLVKMGTALSLLSKITGITALFNAFKNSLLLTRVQLLLLNVQQRLAAAAAVVWAGAQAALNAVMSANPIALIVIALVALVAGFVLAYNKVGWFRDGVNAALSGVGKAFTWLWEHAVKPAWGFISKAIELLWTFYFKPYITLIVNIVKLVGKTFSWLWREAIKPAWDNIRDAISNAWKDTIKPALDNLGKAAGAVGEWFKSLWTDYVKVYWGNVKDAIDTGWQKISGWLGSFETFIKTTLPSAFETGVKNIKTWWDKVEGYAKTPIKFVVDTVYNKGIVPVVNAIPGVDNISEVDTSKWATGGVLPGYTPGRDVHKFVSPTGGGLELSGGEAIMRPEWTRAVGKRGVDLMNRAARKGVGAVQALMGGSDGHANGGVIGGLGRRLSFFLGGVMPLEGGQLTNQHPLPYYDTGATFAGDLNGPYDLRNPPAAVYAWRQGVVSHIGTGYRDEHGRYGNHVVIDHGGGINSWYAHLSSIAAKINKGIAAGAMLGRVGQTGNADGAHLHFETRGGAAPTGTTGGGGEENSKEKAEKSSWLGVVKTIKNAITNFPGMLTDLSAKGGWGSMMVDSVKSIGGQLRQWINDKIPDNFGPIPFPDNPIPKLFDRGGEWRSGTVGMNLSGRTETVMTNENIVDSIGGLAAIARNLRGMVQDGSVAGAGGNAPLVGEVTLSAPPEKVPEVLSDLVHTLRVIRLGGLYADRTVAASV